MVAAEQVHEGWMEKGGRRAWRLLLRGGLSGACLGCQAKTVAAGSRWRGVGG